jgi:branched-chain amino acid transport system ATP-binding protein
MKPLTEIVGRGLIHVPQSNLLFPEMEVLETLNLGARSNRARSDATSTIDKVLTLFPRLAERRKQKVRTLSGGERQMLAIGVGLMGAPRLLMLDEPTLGLSPKLKEELCVNPPLWIRPSLASQSAGSLRRGDR